MSSPTRVAIKPKPRARYAATVAAARRKRMKRIVRPRLKLARVLRILRAHMPDLTARYPIQSLGLFGSYARGDATTSSDLDVLIEFTPGARISLFGIIGLENELSELLGAKVDLMEKQMVRPRILKNVMEDLIPV